MRQMTLLPGRHAVDDGRLHAAGAGAGQRQDRVLRLEDVLQVLRDLGEQLPQLGRAVIGDRLGQLQQGFFGDGRRAGGQQAELHHQRLGNGRATTATL